MKVITDIQGKPFECETNHHFECPCMFGSKFANQRKRLLAEMELWQDTVAKVGRMTEFNDRKVNDINNYLYVYMFCNVISKQNAFRISRLLFSHFSRTLFFRKHKMVTRTSAICLWIAFILVRRDMREVRVLY